MRRHYRNHQSIAGITPTPIPMGPSASMTRPPYGISGHLPPSHAYAAAAANYDRLRMRASNEEALAGYSRAHAAAAAAPPSAYRNAHNIAAAEAAASRSRGSQISPPPPPGYDPYSSAAYAELERREREKMHMRAEYEHDRRERERARAMQAYPAYARSSYYPPYGSPEAHARQLEYSAALAANRTRPQAYPYPYPPPSSHMYSQSVPHTLPPHERARYAEASMRPSAHSASPPAGHVPLAPTDWPQRGHAHTQSAPMAYPVSREKQLRPPPSAAAQQPVSAKIQPPQVRERRDSTVANNGHESEPEAMEARRRELEDVDMDEEIVEISNPKAGPSSPITLRPITQRPLSKEMERSPVPASASPVSTSGSAHGPVSPRVHYPKAEPTQSPVSSPGYSARSKSHSHSYSSPSHIPSPGVSGRERGLSHSRTGSTSSSGHGHGVHPYARPPSVRHAHSLSRDMKERAERNYERDLPPLPPAPPYVRAYATVPESVYSSGYRSGSGSGSSGASPYLDQSRSLYAAPASAENGQRYVY